LKIHKFRSSKLGRSLRIRQGGKLQLPLPQWQFNDAKSSCCAYAEIIQVALLWDEAISSLDKPLIIFNGELDRLRSNYYPPFVYPKLARVGKEFVPKVEAAYYVHNFKGSRPATLFREYPSSWQVWARNPAAGTASLVHEQEERPSLKDVALNIIPRIR
jgi:Domain of unknown function (DUF1995)